MITVIDKQMCTGCCACLNVCPKRCITMERDHEGFWYPKVDTTVCNNCGLCEHVCPLLDGNSISVERLKSPQVLVAVEYESCYPLGQYVGGCFLCTC